MNDTAPRTRWLLLSLLLNVFLLGGLAGAGLYYAWTGRIHASPTPVAAAPAAGATPAAPRGLRFAADALPPAQRNAFRAGLRDARRAAAEDVQAARAGRVELARLMAAPQFDRAAVDAALARTRSADVALRARVEASVADFAASLAPQERAVFAHGLATQSSLRVPPAPAARAP